MKKLLSIVLSVALLLSMFTVIPVAAAEGEETTAITTALGDYYKFTFGADGDQYDYTVANKTVDDTTGQATYNGNTFYPYLIESSDATKASTEYKTITTPDGETYDVLEIKSLSNGYFVPLTEDGTPFEMIPGVKYSVNVKAFNPVMNCWGQLMASAGGLDDKVANYGATVNGVTWKDGVATAKNTNKVGAPFRVSGGSGVVSGGSKAVYMKPGTYGTSAMTLNCIHSAYEVECEHAAASFNAYTDVTSVLGVPEANGVYDEENGTYSTKWTYTDETPDDTTDDVSVTGHNYLTLSLSGGSATSYSTNASYPLYSNATAEEIAEADATSTWQIVSIEVISENFVSKLSYSVNGEIVKTVEGEAGIELEAPAIPEAPEGKYFAAWYEDEACTKLYTSTTLEFGEKTVYAGFKNYGTSLKVDFEDGTYPATAMQYTAAGSFWPLRGYSWKGSSYVSEKNKGELEAHLTREGISTEFPASTVAFYSDRTWGMPGGLYLSNPDGTLFVPEAGATYKVTYKYMAPVHNGNNPAINIVYGILNTQANKTTSADKAHSSKTLKWNTIKEAVTEWTTVTETVTIPEANDTSVPALGLDIGGVKKVAVYEEDGTTVAGYDFSVVLLDSIEVEKIPVSTVTFMNADGTEHSSVPVVVGEEIPYPTLTASFNYDNMWSLSATEYKAVPETVEKEEDITVYAYQNPVLSFENYPVYDDATTSLYGGALPYDNEHNSQVTTEDAYSGTHSMKFRDVYVQYMATEPEDWATTWANYYEYNEETQKWQKIDDETAPTFEANKFGKWRNAVESGMTVVQLYDKSETPMTFNYKISFKYKATANNTEASTLSARVFSYSNIWWGSPTTLPGSFTFPAGATDGWVTGVMYVSANEAYGGSVANQNQVLDLKWDGKGTQYTKEIYIDDIVIEEVETATFNILVDGVTVEGAGNYEDGVFTSFDLSAPVVIAEGGGASIEKWYTDADCTVEATEIVAGGVYYGTLGYVEFIELDGNSVKVYHNEGNVIMYPHFSGDVNYDLYWSLKADAYEAVPENFEKTITVYAVKSDVIGFNSYPGHAYSTNTNLTITDELEDGNKVLKVEDNDYALSVGEKALAPASKDDGALSCWLTPGNNYYWGSHFIYDEETGAWVKLTDLYEEAPEFEEGKYYRNRNNYKDHAIALWSLELGKTYKVTFRYYIPVQLSENVKVIPITSNANIWSAGKSINYTAGVIGTDAKVGEWVEGEVYFTNTAEEGFSMLYIAFSQDSVATKDVIYFDDFALSEAKEVSFVIEEGMTPEGVTAKDGVITLYFDADEEIVAPVVIDADGNPITIWKDAEGNTVTEFVAGGVYTASVAPAFIYGDCNDDGDINTTDLAALKLFLAGSGEVGLGGDCNGDGDINTTDLAALKLFLAGSGTLGPQA